MHKATSINRRLWRGAAELLSDQQRPATRGTRQAKMEQKTFTTSDLHAGSKEKKHSAVAANCEKREKTKSISVQNQAVKNCNTKTSVHWTNQDTKTGSANDLA